jgi:phosphoserine phosphatase RsbU/P
MSAPLSLAWASTPVMVSREPGSQGGRFRIDRSEVLVGRDPTCDVVLSQPTVSRRHARFIWDGVSLVVEDLRSSGGTFVNGARVERAVAPPGSILRLGPLVEFVLEEGSASTPLALATKRETGEQEVKHLQVLLEVARALNSATVIDEVIEIVLGAAVRIMRAEQGCVVLLGADGKPKTVAAYPLGARDATWGEQSTLLERAVKERRTIFTGDELSPSESMIMRGANMAVATPLMVARRPIGAPEDASFAATVEVIGGIVVERRLAGKVFAREDLAVLESVAADAASAIDSAKLYREAREKAKIDYEMSLARTIQSALLRHADEVPFAETFVYSQAARIVGGDLYNTTLRPDGGLGLALGDVSGKGISAALIMAMVQGLLSVLHELDHPVREFPVVLNRNLNRYSTGNRFVTLAVGAVYPDGRLEVANAAHCPVLVLKAGGGEVVIDPHGPMLGILPDAEWSATAVTLDPGDTLVFVSDGITESFSPKGEEFGLDGVLKVARARASESPETVGRAVLDAATAHRAGREAGDDVTLLVLRFRG